MEKSVGSDAHAEGESPAKPPFYALGQAVANAGKPLAALNGDASSILERFSAGESAASIAKSFGISDPALYSWLLRNCPDEWLATSAGRALQRLEKARSDLDVADDKVVISRARESAKLAQWDLERANRKLFGDNKTENGGFTINVVLDRSCEGGVTIEAER
jgi:transposase-like protein